MKKRDIIEILISFVFGILIWFFSVTSKTYKVERDFEITYEGIPDSLTFLEPPPKKIKVEVVADGRSLIFINFFRPKFLINLENPKRGKNIYKTSDIKFVIPHFVKINDIKFKQDFLNLRFDKKSEKEVPVSAMITGNPRSGFTIKLKKAEGYVKITGPLSILKSIDSIKTNYVSVEKREKSFREKVGLLKPSEVIDISPDSIDVYVEIERLEEKDFTNIPYIVLAPKEYMIETEPSKLFLRLKGPESVLRNLNREDISVIVNALNFSEGEFFLKPKVRLPDNVSVVKLEPENVRVKLFKKK
ncbi:MAG: CdaR family protein [candidate division WOR-3 bacterium]